MKQGLAPIGYEEDFWGGAGIRKSDYSDGCHHCECLPKTLVAFLGMPISNSKAA